tara:strand:- start:9862 stop:11106 length:1245 start_codon:yes stop_codon:yes gene_type:complete
MFESKPISQIIIKVYLLGALILLIFYGCLFYYTMLYTENQASEQRLALKAPYHLKLFQKNEKTEIKIDPILTIYKKYEILPKKIKDKINADWQGIQSIHFDDDSEFTVFAKKIKIKNDEITVYAIEDVDPIEWDDTYFAIFQLMIFSTGVILFIGSAFFIIKMAKRISSPFSELAEMLENDSHEIGTPLSVNGKLSFELELMLASINSYRKRIYAAFIREQTFTRYVSHELRTPMTVIRGSVSVLRRTNNDKTVKQLTRIDDAVIEMEQLTHTFLLLARGEVSNTSSVLISDTFIYKIVKNFSSTIRANQVNFHYDIQNEFSLHAHPLLFSAVICNLLKNAINCSIEGSVNLFISEQRIDVIDDGLGLNEQPRGYEGFGIGLKIVQDICDKYQWTFNISNNMEKGCTASVVFKT